MVQARWFLKTLLILLVTLLVWQPTSHAQSSGWELCNESSYIVQVATGRPEGGGTVVNGWTKIRPGSCEYLLQAPLTPGAHYMFAQSSNAHRGGRQSWRGDERLCVESSSSFTIENPPDCDVMGLDERAFKPVLIERRNQWQNTIRETDSYTLRQARAAGVQRLLGDAGVYTGAIDGTIGPRTRTAIRQFLNDRELARDTSDDDLIDILEQVALDRARNVGLTLCNRTNGRIWSAIGRRRGEDWESRGWWLLEAGGCARVIDEPLLQTEHFVFGEFEDPDGGPNRTLSRGSDVFCIARSKFAITGREDCEAAAYRRALFASTPAPTDRKLVYEFFERDFTVPNDG
ncbi:MAG: DUF1036 domain-containing protein, partial [Pseudomonadota bacterium]